MLRAITFFVVTCFAITAFAQEEITPIAVGAEAPFTGMLFPTETAVRWRQRIELLEERLRLDVARVEETSQLRLSLYRDTLRVRTEQYDEDRESLRESIVRASETPWYDAPVLWTIVGVIFGAAIGGVIAGIAVGL